MVIELKPHISLETAPWRASFVLVFFLLQFRFLKLRIPKVCFFLVERRLMACFFGSQLTPKGPERRQLGTKKTMTATHDVGTLMSELAKELVSLGMPVVPFAFLRI